MDYDYIIYGCAAVTSSLRQVPDAALLHQKQELFRPQADTGLKGEVVMSKKKTGLFIALGAALGAAAACISYYLRYKSFNDELDKDFHDYEEEDGLEEDAKAQKKETAERNYITIDSAKGRTQEEDGEEEAPAVSEDETECQEPEEKKSSSDVTVEEDTDGEPA